MLKFKVVDSWVGLIIYSGKRKQLFGGLVIKLVIAGMDCIFLKANRASTALGLQLAQSLFIQVGSLLSFSQVGLCLAELG